MPLMPGHSRAAISANIREMLASGHPRAQAIAAALHTAHRAAGGALTGHGSVLDRSALPTFTPSAVGDAGILPSGLMRTPQVGEFMLDPATGALTPQAQAALRALAQRGLTIGGGAPGAGGAVGGGDASSGANGGLPGGGGGFGTESGSNASSGGGNSIGSVGSSASGGSLPGFNGGPTLGTSLNIGFDKGAAAKTGVGGLISGAGFGAVPAALLSGLFNGSSIEHNLNGSQLGNIDQGLTAGVPGLNTDFGYMGTGIGQDITTGAPGAASSSSGDYAGPNAQELGGAYKHGGAPRADGGATSMPFYTRSEARGMEHPAGLVMSPIGGRSDHIPMNLPSGSYVVPADVVSGIGQGNTTAGGHSFDDMIRSGPHGTRLPMPKLRGTMPKPPGMPRVVGAHHFARGGRMRGRVPVIVAGGERIVSPAEVAKLSGGDLKKGHAMLDRWVVEARKHIIDHTKKLPGPVGAKA